MTGREFDQLIADLERTGQSTDQVTLSADNLGKEFDALGRIIQQTSKLTLDANGRWQSAEGRLQDVRSGCISYAEAARRYAQGIEHTTAEFAGADKEVGEFSNTLAQHLTQLRSVDSNLRESVVPLRHFRLELIELDAALSETDDGFRTVADATELERATQKRLSALDALTQVSRDEIEAQLEIERATLSRVSTQE